MEYYLVRAMEVGRLSHDQLYQLQEHEKTERVITEYGPQGDVVAYHPRSKRCLMPYEIQEIFHLPSLKETWNIPEKEAAQEQHKMNLKKMFRAAGLIPEKGDLNSLNVDDVHAFDERVKTAFGVGKIDFVCQINSGNKRIKDDL